MSRRWLTLAGVGAALGYAAKFVARGLPNGFTADAATTFRRHEGLALTMAVTTAVTALLVVVLAAAVATAPAAPEPVGAGPQVGVDPGRARVVAAAGGVLLAAYMLLRSSLALAALDATSAHDPVAVRLLVGLGSDLWLGWMAGAALLLLGTGVVARRAASVPRWFATLSLALGVLCLLGPAAILVDLVLPVWLLLLGVVLGRPAPVAAAAPGLLEPAEV